jgi:hypothetical protein
MAKSNSRIHTFLYDGLYCCASEVADFGFENEILIPLEGCRDWEDTA